MNIKTTIGIIAVVISSISMAEAGQNRHERDNERHYDNSRQKHHYRQNHRRPHWKRARHARHHYREQRHYRRHYGSRHQRYERSHRHHTNWKRDHGYRHSTYSSPRVYSSHSVVVRNTAHSGNILPVIAGGLIGSSIADNASGGDPAATFGGAIFGALVGNAIAHH